MNQYIDIAIDIETLSLASDAAIISIAAQPFARPVRGMEEAEDYELFKPAYINEADEFCQLECEPFRAYINATTCAFAGMDFDPKTIQWWSERDDAAKAAAMGGPSQSIGQALECLQIFLEVIKNTVPDCRLRMWAQGGDFDFSVLRSAFRRCLPGTELPWDYRDQRDARTFILEALGVENPGEDPKKLYDLIPPMEDEEPWVKHSALSDARRTAHNVAFCTQVLL